MASISAQHIYLQLDSMLPTPLCFMHCPLHPFEMPLQLVCDVGMGEGCCRSMGGRAACSTYTCKHVASAVPAITSRRSRLVTLTIVAAILTASTAQELTYADLVAKVSSSPSIQSSIQSTNPGDGSSSSSNSIQPNGPPSPPASPTGTTGGAPPVGSFAAGPAASGPSPSPIVPPSPAGGPSPGTPPRGEPPQPGSSPSPTSPSPDGPPQGNIGLPPPGVGSGSLIAAGPAVAVAPPPSNIQGSTAAAPGAQAMGASVGTNVPFSSALPPSGLVGTNVDPLAGALPGDALKQYSSAGQTTALNIPTSVGAGEARQPDIPPGTDPQTAAMLRVQAAAQQQLGITGGAPAPSSSPNQPDGAIYARLLGLARITGRDLMTATG